MNATSQVVPHFISELQQSLFSEIEDGAGKLSDLGEVMDFSMLSFDNGCKSEEGKHGDVMGSHGIADEEDIYGVGEGIEYEIISPSSKSLDKLSSSISSLSISQSCPTTDQADEATRIGISSQQKILLENVIMSADAENEQQHESSDPNDARDLNDVMTSPMPLRGQNIVSSDSSPSFLLGLSPAPPSHARNMKDNQLFHSTRSIESHDNEKCEDLDSENHDDKTNIDCDEKSKVTSDAMQNAWDSKVIRTADDERVPTSAISMEDEDDYDKEEEGNIRGDMNDSPSENQSPTSSTPPSTASFVPSISTHTFTTQRSTNLATPFKTPDSSPQKPVKGVRSKDRGASIYYRIVGRKTMATIGPMRETVLDDPEASLSTISSLKDRLMSFMNGETELERKTRLRLNWYKDMLTNEVNIFKRAKLHHYKHGVDLALEFERQEIQLQRWGLVNILPVFRMQAWARVSRAGLLEDIAQYGIKILSIRLERAGRVIAQFNDSNTGRKQPLSAYSAFCLLPEEIISRDEHLRGLALRLLKLDRICNSSLQTFRAFLPELESRTFAQRKHMLSDILNRYSEWLSLSEPAHVEEQMNGKWNISQGGGGDFAAFCDWYALRLTAMTDLERDFGTFVEDEREREGRLFRRWCLLAMADNNSAGNLEKDGKPSNVQGNGDGTNGLLTPSSRAALLSPRSIRAFIKYFSLSVIAGRYSVTHANQEALVALTESLVYRRINCRVFRYPSKALQARDVNWRLQCFLCKQLNPLTFGVPPEYISPIHAAEASEGIKKGVYAYTDSEGKNFDDTVDDNNDAMADITSGSNCSMSCNNDNGNERPDGSQIDGNEIEVDKSDNETEILGQNKTENTNQEVHIADDLSVGECTTNKSEKSVSSHDSSTRSFLQTLDGINIDGGAMKHRCECNDCKVMSLSRRLQMPVPSVLSSYGAPYANTIRILSLVGTSINPRDITFNLLMAIKWLLRDATNISGKRDFLGADVMFPILVLVLMNSNLPCMYLILHFLHNFGDYDRQGEAAYYCTCLEAAVAYILRFDVPQEIREQYPLSTFEDGRGLIDDSNAEGQNFENIDDGASIAKLGEWLRDQQTMEDTISILQQEGWMV